MVKRILLITLLLCGMAFCSCSTAQSSGDEVVTFPPQNNITDITDITDTTEAETTYNDPPITEAQQTSAVTEETTAEAPADITKPLSGLKICIDPGHGKFAEGYSEPIAPGSSETKAAFVSGTAGQYQSEAEFNLKLSLILKPMLEEEGALVYMTRTDENATLSNVGRAEYANELGCDMVVRIHADGSNDSSVSGLSVLVPGANEYFNDKELISASSEAGQRVLDSLIANTGAINRGLIERNDLTGFNWTEVPCILIECGFMSNAEDDKKLADENYRILLAQGITQGLIEYYMTA